MILAWALMASVPDAARASRAAAGESVAPRQLRLMVGCAPGKVMRQQWIVIIAPLPSMIMITVCVSPQEILGRRSR